MINWSPQETRVAMVEGGSLQELHIERTLDRGLVGNVYLGKVARVLPGIQSAFVEIGLDRAAFLHVADVWHPPGEAVAMARGSVPQIPIEKQVFEGQSLMVQVIKNPLGTKGARLSTQISMAGRMLVFLPQDDHIGVSQKIPVSLRDELRERIKALAGDAGGGFIVRTHGEDASEQELSDDMAYLRKAWQQLREAAVRQPVTSLLHQDLSLLQRVLRDMASDTTQTIKIDSLEQFGVLQAFGQQFMPAATQKLQYYSGDRSIFDLYSIDEEIVKALDRQVNLKSGGYLIVEQTEALTTVDVNTGGFVGTRNFDDTIFRTNLEAAQAIARQLRLRNLGGMIVVDFIDMEREDHRLAVLAAMRKQLANDRVKTMCGGFSQLGLVEMTRKRTRESLAHTLCEPCIACNGTGIVKTARSVVYDIFREIARESRQFNPQEFRIVASSKVIDLFLDEESQHLTELSEFIGKPVSLHSDSTMGQEQYEIVLI